MPPQLILVSGFAGSGKSSLADSLGKKLGMKVVHASAMLREMATKGVKALENASPEKIEHWWETDEGKEFMKKRLKDPTLDKALDEKLMDIARRGELVMDSWTMPYLYKGTDDVFRIWLKATPQERAKRVSGRDKMDYENVLAKILSRDEDTKALYKRLYNFEMGSNLGKFSLVINTGKIGENEVFSKVIGKIRGD